MTGTGRDMIDAWRAELVAEAAQRFGRPEASQSTFLRRLEASNFDSTNVAWDDCRLLRQESYKTNWAGSEALVHRAKALQVQAVREFAKSFFSQPPNVRNEKWLELAAKTSFAPAAAWLDRLKGGLMVNRDPPPVDELQAELADRILELFVLPPNQRMQPRQLFLEKCRRRPVQWRKVARGLQAARPDVATLGWSLIKEILRLPSRHQPFVRGVALRRITNHSQSEAADQKQGIPPAVAAIFILGAITASFSELARSQPRIHPSDLYPKTSIEKVRGATNPSQKATTGKIPAPTGKSPKG